MLGRGRQPRDIHRLDLHLHLRPRHGLAPLTSPPSPHDVLRREPHNAVQMYLRRRPARGTIATLTHSLAPVPSPPPAYGILPPQGRAAEPVAAVLLPSFRTHSHPSGARHRTRCSCTFAARRLLASPAPRSARSSSS